MTEQLTETPVPEVDDPEHEPGEEGEQRDDVDEGEQSGDVGEPGRREDDDEHQDDEDEEHAHDEAQLAAQRADADTVAVMERRGKQLDNLERYIGRKLEEIFGKEEADTLQPCELCSWTRTFGWRVDDSPPDFVREAVKRAIGLGTLDELRSYAAFETCPTCNGLGNVKTGSQVTQFLYRTCPTCKGRGYSSSLPEDELQVQAGTPVAAMPLEDGAPPQSPDRDQFGTPRDHPDYGKMPQHRQVPISHWASFAENPSV